MGGKGERNWWWLSAGDFTSLGLFHTLSLSSLAPAGVMAGAVATGGFCSHSRGRLGWREGENLCPQWGRWLTGGPGAVGPAP